MPYSGRLPEEYAIKVGRLKKKYVVLINITNKQNTDN